MNRITLLMLMLALSLAPILCWAEPNAEQARVIAEITGLWGGEFTVDEKSPDKDVISVDLEWTMNRRASENPPIYFGPLDESWLVKPSA